MTQFVTGALFLLVLALAVSAWRRRRQRRASVGPGAAGAIYDLLNEDKRAALEIVVEQRAAYRDPEDRDGDLPQLAAPTGRNRH